MYVLIRSWHRVRTVTRGGGYLTLCGRSVAEDALTSASFGDDKSCETCLRIMSRLGL